MLANPVRMHTLVAIFFARVLKLRETLPPGEGYTGSATIEGRGWAKAEEDECEESWPAVEDPRFSVRQPPPIESLLLLLALLPPPKVKNDLRSGG